MTLPGLMQPAPLVLRDMFDRMREVYPDGEVVSPEGRTTYGELSERILRLAGALRELGVKPGDRVATFAYNSTRHLALYYAVPLLGAVLHTINVRLYADQIVYVIDHAQDQLVFADAETAPALSEVAPKLDCVRAYVRMGEGDEGLCEYDFDSLVEQAKPIEPSSLPDVPENAAFGLCYTSGTTGMPKGVLSSHRAMWLHSMAIAMAGNLAITEHDRIFPVVPMFHAFGWGLPYAAPFVGAELVLHGSDSTPENVGRLIQDERVTVSAGVPTIWKELLPQVQAGKVKAPELRAIFVGGSALPGPLIKSYDEIGKRMVQLWGMTETGPMACISTLRRSHRDASDSEILEELEKTGTIMPGLQARIVAPDGTTCPRDGATVGELEVRGPWIARGYYRDDSDERFHDGWLRTGDMAWMERDGTFRIVDRAKDLVKSGGEWISSVELECELLAHPDVLDAAVVGVSSRKWDERPVAVIVPRANAPTLESIRAFLAERVAKWWLPDAVIVVDEIPKTSVGKIDKKVLRSQLQDMELP